MTAETTPTPTIIVEYNCRLEFSRDTLPASKWTQEEWDEALAVARGEIEIEGERMEDFPAFDWRGEAVVESEVDDVWIK